METMSRMKTEKSKLWRDSTEMDIWNEYEAKVGTLFSETGSIVTKEQGVHSYKTVCWISSDKIVCIDPL